MFTPETLTYWLVVCFVCAVFACRKPTKKELLTKNKNDLFKKNHASNFSSKRITPVNASDVQRILARISNLSTDGDQQVQDSVDNTELPRPQGEQGATGGRVHGMGNFTSR